jgi:hypothetical protein
MVKNPSRSSATPGTGMPLSLTHDRLATGKRYRSRR